MNTFYRKGKRVYSEKGNSFVKMCDSTQEAWAECLILNTQVYQSKRNKEKNPPIMSPTFGKDNKMENQLLERILVRLYTFRDEVVANDMIVPAWVIDSIQEIEAAQQSAQADVNYCYGPNNHLLKDGELCGECGLPKPPNH